MRGHFSDRLQGVASDRLMPAKALPQAPESPLIFRLSLSLIHSMACRCSNTVISLELAIFYPLVDNGQVQLALALSLYVYSLPLGKICVTTSMRQVGNLSKIKIA